ncbi:MAG: phosphate acyltransferase PlsX [Chloroflexota bacterium]
MGGDHAPEEVLRGAVEAHKRGVDVVLVGPRDVLEYHLSALHARLPIVHAQECIAMDEPVAHALRRKDSSLLVAAHLVTDGSANAVVSCGNSGAIMAVALHAWGRQSGIDRPAFGSTLPTRYGGVFVLDIGANPTVKASNLAQFAVMGNVFARLSRNIDSPRIALLSNGTEDSKGTKEVKEANEAIRKLDINFIGNVEGNQIFDGRVDVVVSDGFTGNVLIKAGEAVAVEIFDLLKTELQRDLLTKVAATALMPVFQRIKKRVDYEEYGGAPVLGVNEVMINCHGRSKAKAVTNAILLAHRMAEERLIDRIGEALQYGDADAARKRRRLVRALHLRHGDA